MLKDTPVQINSSTSHKKSRVAKLKTRTPAKKTFTFMHFSSHASKRKMLLLVVANFTPQYLLIEKVNKIKNCHLWT